MLVSWIRSAHVSLPYSSAERALPAGDCHEAPLLATRAMVSEISSECRYRAIYLYQTLCGAFRASNHPRSHINPIDFSFFLLQLVTLSLVLLGPRCVNPRSG